jgi:5-methyltetrahydropteroyltriglutamate--homocysteine methyltransferase
MGAQRELKRATEAYWAGAADKQALEAVVARIERDNWKRQHAAGLSTVATGDHVLYDHVLTHTAAFGAIPARYGPLVGGDPLTLYFAMARGQQGGGVDVTATEMTKWFDTNYHYMVPEFSDATQFALQAGNPFVRQCKDATAEGFAARPVLVGPVTYLSLGKMAPSEAAADTTSLQCRALELLLPRLLPVYVQLLRELRDAGAEWVQIDEPVLALDLTAAQRSAFATAYATLGAQAQACGAKLLLTTYFDGLRDNAELAFGLGTAGVHVDLVRAPQQLDDVLALVRPGQVLSVGVVDGRNIWKNDLERSIATVRRAVAALGGERVVVASSCSLLHSPVDLAHETALDAEVKQWLAFAQQKLEEVALIARAVGDDSAAEVKAALAANKAAVASRATSVRIHDANVKRRTADVTAAMLQRGRPFPERVALQQELLKLPLLPTTTIGSFPQTAEVRKARADFKAGRLTAEAYDAFLEAETRRCIAFQEAADISVPVHGEFERNDMVEYFGEQLSGFVFSQNGWVQSYGSRCVKPPIIFGDVSRPRAMTVRWSSFAQSLTARPVKGMLTGPVTILQWSFVRDDQPREATCKQIALAIRDETVDLERAGVRVIQIDEPAVREGLPLRGADKEAYLTWAVDAFRLCAGGVQDATQIHTHMCYCDFNDIMPQIAALDADVISIETSRSAMELLSAFAHFKYPNHIGPGVYDIHSPRVPAVEEMVLLLRKALEVLEPAQLWVNPDCGLKTRGWKEVQAALTHMVAAAATVRAELAAARV